MPEQGNPLPLLRQLMAEDCAAGVPFIEAWRANTSCACRHRGSTAWLRAILGTERAWRLAYEGAQDGLEHFSIEDLMTEV